MERSGQIQDGTRETELTEARAGAEIMNRALWSKKESTEELLIILWSRVSHTVFHENAMSCGMLKVVLRKKNQISAQ